MITQKITKHDPLVVALIAAMFVWIVFDSVGLGLIAGLVGFISVGKSQKDSEDKSSQS